MTHISNHGYDKVVINILGHHYGNKLNNFTGHHYRNVLNDISGHRYGNTLVPMTEDDKLNMKYKAEKCFKVLGFTKSENVSGK